MKLADELRAIIQERAAKNFEPSMQALAEHLRAIVRQPAWGRFNVECASKQVADMLQQWAEAEGFEVAQYNNGLSSGVRLKWGYTPAIDGGRDATLDDDGSITFRQPKGEQNFIDPLILNSRLS